jgi:outer membrane protein OmpA-like peptidoglycan-associated protein
MKKFFKLSAAVFLMFILSSCSAPSPRGGGNSPAASAKKNVRLLSRKLSGYNVHAFHNTNLLKLTLPNDVFFTKDSANFTANAYEALDLVHSLSNYYKESSVAVTGYYLGRGDESIDKALATERARKVAQQLWKARIDSNFVYASGTGVDVYDSRKSVSDCVVVEVKY